MHILWQILYALRCHNLQNITEYVVWLLWISWRFITQLKLKSGVHCHWFQLQMYWKWTIYKHVSSEKINCTSFGTYTCMYTKSSVCAFFFTKITLLHSRKCWLIWSMFRKSYRYYKRHILIKVKHCYACILLPMIFASSSQRFVFYCNALIQYIVGLDDVCKSCRQR